MCCSWWWWWCGGGCGGGVGDISCGSCVGFDGCGGGGDGGGILVVAGVVTAFEKLAVLIVAGAL